MIASILTAIVVITIFCAYSEYQDNKSLKDDDIPPYTFYED